MNAQCQGDKARDCRKISQEELARKTYLSGESPGVEEETKSSEGGRAGEDEVLQF